MSSYQVKVMMRDVYNYDKNDGQGDYIYSSEGYEIFNCPNISDAKASINEYFGFAPDSNDICDDYIRMTLIEDSDGNPDEEGNYIVDYFVVINKIEPVVWRQSNANEIL